MQQDQIPLSTLATAFQVFNKTTGKSPGTVAWYDMRLALYGRFAGPDASLGDITPARVREYIVELQERTERHPNNPFNGRTPGKLSSSYIHGHVRALRAFASWLFAEGYTETNRLATLRPPKMQLKVTPVLNDTEVGALLGCFRRDDAYGARNYTIALTLLDCGLRVSELCDLKTADAHLREGYLKVLGKGNKERLVPIGGASEAALSQWLTHFRPLFVVNEAPQLFLDASGGALSTAAVQELIKRAGQRAGVPRVTCHLLRHTFATNYLVREVGDPLRLQQILGHTSLEMVRHYVAAANVQQSLIERRSSPMDLILNGGTSANARRLQPSRGTSRTEAVSSGGSGRSLVRASTPGAVRGGR
jgi:site-specific recombinase XerD